MADTDIVERLLGLADCDSRAGEPLGKCMREAAAEITRLRADLAASTGGNEMINRTGTPAGWAAVYDGQIKSCHRSRETCIADAEHYQAICPVYLGPAWRHQED